MRAVERQIDSPRARKLLLKQLAFENANEDCKTALTPIYNNPDTDIHTMLRVCQNVGSQTHKARLLAAAVQTFQQANNPAASKRCFGCGREGHFRAQCRSVQRSATAPVWVDQWPLPLQKLQAVEALIQEQLQLGHIQPSSSPWNTPIFVIKKKSGKWRLLQDLRKVNERMQVMGPVQCGMPNPNLIPQNYKLKIIDLKDCFFNILLAPQDREKFAFTVPVLNNDRPTQRYEWCVLPQGMANSPTLCQLFVALALQPFRSAFPDLMVYHYMDDILIAGKNVDKCHMDFLVASLEAYGLYVAPEKVQEAPPFKYLGHQLSEKASVPVLPQFHIPETLTLVQLQSLLGNINWARPSLALTTDELSPLFMALAGHSSPADKIPVTPAMKAAFKLLAQRLRVRAVDRLLNEDLQFSCFILSTPSLPTAILYVPKDKETICIIEWIYLPHTPSRNLYPWITAVADLFFKARHRTLQLTGKDIDCVFFPFKQEEVERLLGTSSEFQVAFAGFLGTVLHNPPKDKRLQLFSQISYKLTSCFSLQPLSHAITLFTDGSPTRGVVTWQMPGGSWSSKFTENQSSAQRSELAAVILAFQLFAQEDFNLIVDT
uniref:ribonuclease H n=1 Tax=Varanus komodoensis TaxID=61221 RepID=A0A8D2IV37_VARKO